MVREGVHPEVEERGLVQIAGDTGWHQKCLLTPAAHVVLHRLLFSVFVHE